MQYNDKDSSWWPRPSLGDICWCWFPVDAPLLPGPKPRPCLICSMSKASDSERYQVEVAFGTSQKTQEIHPGEFLITQGDGKAFSIAHLAKPTKFNLKLLLRLPYNSDFFGVPPWIHRAKTPKIGVLDLSVSSTVKPKFEASKQAAGLL